MSRYISTRGGTQPQSFTDVLLAGLAGDGGLFVPEVWPQIAAEEIAGFARQPYPETAFAIMKRFAGDAFPSGELKADIDAAYAAFDDPAIVPLIEIDPGLFLLELFHGPTLAFKDIALQILGRLFARVLKKRDSRATVVVATSGDTGSAAIAALGGLERIELFVLHPKGRISEVQRRQMTTSPHANVHNVALEGTFDEAQAIVKSLFADSEFAARVALTAVNSINFTRIAAQSVYYFTAAARLGAAPVFVVPTGNFGDAFAGEVAMHMGLGVNRIIIATNANDILARALNGGVYASGAARTTLSPSMDIQVASNFERALYEASGRDAVWLKEAMEAFASTRQLVLPAALLTNLRSRYSAQACDDTAILEIMARVHRDFGRLIDPHTAVAMSAALRMRAGTDAPIVVLSTAAPAKFPEVAVRATGRTPSLPSRLAGLYEREERATVLPNELAAVRGFIERRLSKV